MRAIVTCCLSIVLSGVLPVRAQPGDANCDGITDPGDLGALILALFGVSACPTADVNGDARVAVADVTALLGLLSATPVAATPTSTSTQLPTPAASPSPPIPTPSLPLFSTYLGGSGDDFIRDVVTDAAGNVYLTGGTASPDFPATAGSYDTSANGWMDVFVTKLSPDGSLLWSTFLGGPNYDRAYAIELDPQGNVIVGGRAGAGFPTTPGVVQPFFAGDTDPNDLYGPQDGFVAALSPDGRRLLWSTYFGGADRSFLRDIAVDDNGDVLLAETFVSADSPHITVGAYQTVLRGGPGGVIARLTSNGTEVAWATYFDGTGVDFGTPAIRVGGDHNVYVSSGSAAPDSPTTANAYRTKLAGSFDMHVAKLSADGSRLLYATYLGGSANEFSETHGLAVDTEGRAIVAFTTRSTDIPTTTGAFQAEYAGNGGNGTGAGTNYSGDGYVAIVASDGTRLVAATYLGGNFGDGIEGVNVDAEGRVYVSGATFSTRFPLSANAAQRMNRGKSDFFVAALSPSLSTLLYGTYLGGSGADEGRGSFVDRSGRFVVVGHTRSNDWPVLNPLQRSYRSGEDGALAVLNAVQHPM